MEDSELEEREAEYQSRNESIRHTIDVLAQYDTAELDEHGKKSEIAREHDIETHRIYYVLNHWKDLVGYRRHANTDPLDPEAVKAAYDDDTMQALAGQQPVADGAGNINIQITLTLDEVFRAIKLLPGDLGLKVYSQALSADIPRSEIRAILEADN